MDIFKKIKGVTITKCLKLVVARLPKTTKTLFRQPVFRKNKGPVAQDCLAFDIRTTFFFPNFEPNFEKTRSKDGREDFKIYM